MRLLGFKVLGKAFAVATATGLCLVLTEYAARFLFRDVTTTSHVSYLTRRWDSTVRKNSWGFREREFDPNKSQGVYRIAVVGDSITFGQGINVDQRFTNILENRLNAYAGGHNYEVLNFGRRGAETVDEVQFLTERVLGSKPDFILLQWYHNDVEDGDKAMRPAPYRLIPSEFLTSLFQRKSLLFYLTNQHWISLQWRLGLLQSYPDYMRARFGDPDSSPSRAAHAELRKFIHLCREHEIPLGIVLVTLDPEFGFLADRVLRQCKEERRLCVDLRESFAEARPDWASRLDPHPGPVANRLIANRLLETYGPIWWRFSNSRKKSA